MISYRAFLALAAITYLAHLLSAQYSKKFAGPYTLKIRGIDDCPNGDSLPFVQIGNKVRIYNRTTVLYSLNISTTVPISNEMEMRFAFSTFGNGGWSNEQMEQNMGPACTALWNILPGTMKGLMESLGQKDCPILPGNYTVKAFPLDLNINWPLLPYDRYRFEERFYLSGKLVGCKRFYVDCVPKNEPRTRKGNRT